MILLDNKKKVASIIAEKLNGRGDYEGMKHENSERMAQVDSSTQEALDENGALDTFKIALERKDPEAMASSLKSIVHLMMSRMK